MNTLKALNLSDGWIVVKGVTVIEAGMDDGSGYCGSNCGIESVSDVAKIANMVMTGAGER